MFPLTPLCYYLSRGVNVLSFVDAGISTILIRIQKGILMIIVFLSRWEVIANYMNLHSTSGMKRTAKDVINKAKNLQRLGMFGNEENKTEGFIL